MRDCMALLEAKNTLEGTPTLNWGLDTDITNWDGVTTDIPSGQMHNYVTKLELPNESLNGSIPVSLGKPLQAHPSGHERELPDGGHTP